MRRGKTDRTLRRTRGGSELDTGGSAPLLSALEGLRGYSFEFVQEDGAVMLLRSHQPNGVFEAKRVESGTTER